MMRSLYSGVAGLRVSQTKMDVVGNNIANINTIGYKKSRTVFQDMISQTLRGASQPTANVGGMNPVQVGLGVSLGSIDVLHTQGPAMSTGNNFDVMLQGDGYFVVADAVRDINGEVNWADPDASYDPGSVAYTRAGNFAFDEEGFLVCTSTGKYVLSYVSDADPDVDGTLSLVQVPISNVSNVSVDAQGYITFNDDQGNIGSFAPDNIYYDDGTPHDYGVAAPIAVAKFNNPMGLSKIGMNMYNETNNSGIPNLDGPNGRHGQGSLLPGNLEMSNVDLAEEFTDMIVTQRGHQANARTIRTSDEMLQELAQIKR